jgi:uncharacterized cupin superfamily protein
MNTFNIFEAQTESDPDEPEGFRASEVHVEDKIGASMITARLYDMEPGNSNCPYHYEYNNEEWLLVLQGELTIRVPDGEMKMRAGDVTCFPVGPDGAHRLTSSGDETARFLFFSTDRYPAVAVYPDSDKVGVWPDPSGTDELMVKRADNKDYWEGELG